MSGYHGPSDRTAQPAVGAGVLEQVCRLAHQDGRLGAVCLVKVSGTWLPYCPGMPASLWWDAQSGDVVRGEEQS